MEQLRIIVHLQLEYLPDKFHSVTSYLSQFAMRELVHLTNTPSFKL
jgi:hypothetical protein